MLLESRAQTIIFFFFNDTATTEIYTLSLHDALPISRTVSPCSRPLTRKKSARSLKPCGRTRSEEHTSELQSRLHLVCRLLLEKKKHFEPAHDAALTQTEGGVPMHRQELLVKHLHVCC